MTADESWMTLALAEARRGVGLTSPNPSVGAVIVRDGGLLGSGWHRKAGGPHAEVEALSAAVNTHGADAVLGATIYITLEPCSTQGRTPPCVEALQKAGLARVVWGAEDPNPLHAGRARGILEAAGMEVLSGVLAAECEDFLAPWAKYITQGLPWVIAKAGMSLDGRITRPAGEGQWITSDEARADAMALRAQCDAIVVGAETVRCDDPALTLRGTGISPEKEQPWRVVLTRSGNLPAEARLLTDAWRDRTLVMQGDILEEVLRHLAGRGVVRVLLEGGGGVLAQAFAANLVDEAVFYTAPLISGSGRPVVDAAAFSGGSVALAFTGADRIGPDLRLRARRQS